MRFFVFLMSVLSLILVVYNIRYKLLNVILGVGVLRKVIISIVMRSPKVRNKINYLIP